MGILLLLDLVVRAGDLGAMYSDAGMFPRELIRHYYTSGWNWSFHFGGGTWGYQAALFAISAALALAMATGFWTRLAVVGSWLMLVSIQNRLPPVLSGSDNLLRMLLFWSIFLPLGRVWSLDRWLRSRRGEPPPDGGPVVSVASAAILLQMGLMYLFSAVFKTNADWIHGEVVAGTLAHDMFANPAGESLLQFPGVLKAATLAVLALEWSAPLLLFSPFWTARLRLVAVALLAAMHLGIAACVEVGQFSFVALAGLSLFLPAGFWDSRWLKRLAGSSPPPPGADLAPGPPQPAARAPALAPAARWFCLAALAYVVAVNFNSLPARPLGWLKPERWDPLWTGLGLGQRWNMFDQTPSNDGWYVAWAKLADGSEVDLLRGGAPTDWRRPTDPGQIYPNHRWRKLLREMSYQDELGYQVFRQPFAQFLCSRWDEGQPPGRQVAELNLLFCSEGAPGAAGKGTTRITADRLATVRRGR
jgi:hypothetical protein